MRSIFVVGRYGSGKTAVCLAMALKFKEEGHRVGYLKPIGFVPSISGREDKDVSLMHTVCGCTRAPEELVVMHVGPQYPSRYHQGGDHLERILKAYQSIQAECDVVIVEGTLFPHIMASLGLDSPSLAHKMQAQTLIVNSVEDDYTLDRIILYQDYIRTKQAHLLGVLFNNVPRPLLAKTEGVYQPILQQMGTEVLGIIPRNMVIAAPTVKTYYDVLGGELLTGENNLDQLVEEVMVGAMGLEGALSFMRRAPNKAFITGGDRSDLALAALETSTSVIILTGGLYPDVRVIARAVEKSVPIILVHYDTYTTIEKLREVSRKLGPQDTQAIAAAKAGFEQHCDWETIKKSIGL